MNSPTQGAWDCRHGVDGRDWCDECYAPAPTYEKRQARLAAAYARHSIAAHGTCRGCGMGAHKPDNICDGTRKEKKP